MPIPSLSSAAKPLSQLSRANSIARSERLGQPTRDEHSGAPTASNRLRERSQSQSVSLEQTSNHAVKKRSLLPQRGLPKAVVKPAGGAEVEASRIGREDSGQDNASSGTMSQQAGLGDAKLGRLRPRSLYQTRDTSTLGIEGATHPSHPSDASVQPPVSTGLSRTQSLRRAGASAQSAPAPAPARRTHTRTQSTNTLIGARKEIAESDKAASRVERPKSLVVATTHTKPSNGVPADAAPGVGRSSARLEALKRSASTKSRSALPHNRAGGTPSNAEHHSQPKEGHEAIKQEPKKTARPAFSTLQQHFTPRKTGKAPTSSFLHAPEPTNHVLPPEIISLQNELLQLHLLHQSSAMTSMQWEMSAQKILRMKFDEVVTLNQTMQENERFGQEQKNIIALREWSGSNSLSGLVQHIQALAGPLHELPSLLDPGGRFFHLVEAFSKWFSWVDGVWSDRHERHGEGNAMHSLEGLGAAWRGEHAAMMRKLTAFSRELDSLPPTVRGSSIAHIVSRCQSLVDGLLNELHIMQALETEVITREKQWVEERLRSIAQNVVDEPLQADEKAWRMY